MGTVLDRNGPHGLVEERFHERRQNSQYISMDAFCARASCMHPLWWHLWQNFRQRGKLYEVGVCKSECNCLGFLVIATPKMVKQ